jgi:hypothetical protein
VATRSGVGHNHDDSPVDLRHNNDDPAVVDLTPGRLDLATQLGGGAEAVGILEPREKAVVELDCLVVVELALVTTLIHRRHRGRLGVSVHPA